MAPRIRSLLIVAAASALAPKPARQAVDRRQLAKSIAGLAGAIAGASAPRANAVVYLDPARYGDQELKNAAIAKYAIVAAGLLPACWAELLKFRQFR